MRLSGEGAPGEHGGATGDLYVVVHVKEHPIFVREDTEVARGRESHQRNSELGMSVIRLHQFQCANSLRKNVTARLIARLFVWRCGLMGYNCAP